MSKLHPYRIALFAVFTAVLLGLSACGKKSSSSSDIEVAGSILQSAESAAEEPYTNTVRFSASGDNLIHEGLYKSAAQRAAEHPESGKQYDFSYCYANMLDFYAGFDLNWINQESLVNDAFEPSNYPHFSTPGQMAWDLYDAGFRVVNLSNNHVYDKGADGISATLDLWSTLPSDLVTTGLYNRDNHSPIVYKSVNDIRIAFLAYAEMTNGIPTPANASYGVVYLDDTDIIREQMQQARANADFVIVSCHWGTENSHIINDAQRSYARMLSDMGADLIIGTHPHVIQDAEWITSASGHNTFVAYSLGNYLNGQDGPDQMIGTVLAVDLQKTVFPDGTAECSVIDPILYPVINHFDWKYKNGRMYLFSDYNESLAASHGISEFFSGFTMEYIQNVLNRYISVDFLPQL